MAENEEEEEVMIKLVMVGSDKSGKTAALIKYATNFFPKEYLPNLFDNYQKRILVDKEQYILYVCDTAGQDAYDQIRPLSYSQTDVFVLCYGVDRRDTFESITSKWIPELQTRCPDPPRMLMALKTDLRSTVDSCVTKEEGEKLARDNGMEYMEASALTGQNITECFGKAAVVGLEYLAMTMENEDSPTDQDTENCENNVESNK